MKGTLSLKIIQEKVKNCKKCDLCTSRKNAVPGKGNHNADIVFIGEAPGKNEDECGEPFIGTAGKKLNVALKNAGLERSDVYITILGGNEISKIHGKFVSKDDYLYFISFHPAAIIYNQKLKKVFKNDMKKLVDELKKLKTKSGD